MLVVLQATSNYARPQQFQLRANQVAKVGRSEWADFSFSGDSVMSDVQFEIRSSADECTIVSLSSKPPTRVNGQEVQSSPIRDGDQIDAGETRFLVHIEGDRSAPRPRTVPPADVASSTKAPIAAGAAALTLAATCAYLEFGDDVNELAASAKTPDALIDELAAQGKVQDALRLRATYFPSGRPSGGPACVFATNSIRLWLLDKSRRLKPPKIGFVNQKKNSVEWPKSARRPSSSRASAQRSL